MKTFLRSIVGLVLVIATSQAQTIPNMLWGKWIVRRVLPTTTTSCWDYDRAKTLVDTEIEYSAENFRWKDLVTRRPTARTELLNAQEFERTHSGQGRDSSQIRLRQLGITASEITQISIEHPPADFTGATIEIPGDHVLLKDKNTIVFSVCNVYLEARRLSVPQSTRFR